MTDRRADLPGRFALISSILGFAGMIAAPLAFVAFELEWLSRSSYTVVASVALLPVGLCWILGLRDESDSPRSPKLRRPEPR